ncbi:TonB family protein, partial [Halorhodospira sp. 9621]
PAEQRAEEQERLREEIRQRMAEEREAQRQQELEAERQRQEAARQEAEEQRRLQGQQQRYTAAIAEAVERNWRRPTGTPEGLEAVIRVSFSRSGDVRRVEVVSGSGDSGFDRSVERAVQAASPVPFPDEAALQERMQTITFRFAPDRS